MHKTSTDQPLRVTLFVSISLFFSCFACSRLASDKESSKREFRFTTEMTDAQILKALRLDIAKLNKEVAHGDNGWIRLYCDDVNLVGIGSTKMSGPTVTRFKPTEEYQQWPIHSKRKTPNKAPEPTLTSVTPPAAQEARRR